MKIRKALLISACTVAAAYFGVCASAQQTNWSPAVNVPNTPPPNGTIDTHNSLQHPFRPKPGGGSFSSDPQFNPVHKPRHLVYIAEPGGSAGGEYPEHRNGIIVLDADRNYAFLKHIYWGVAASEAPGPEVSGITANVPLNMLYIELRSRLIAIDLKTDKVVWENAYGGNNLPASHEGGIAECCERAELSPDGRTLVVGSNLANFWYVVDAKTGDVRGKIFPAKTRHAHNVAVAPDGKTVFLAASAGNPPVLSIADLATRKVIQTITFSDLVRPFVINHDGSRVYANVDNLLGFEIGDAKTGKMIKRVEAPAEMWKSKWADPNQHFFGHACPSHGIGLTPDESELWVVDDINDGVLVYDNHGDDNFTLDNKKSFKTTAGADWITMGLDGKLAYLASGDIVDVKTHKIVGQLKDEFGVPLHSEKQLELAFLDGKLVQAESQFAEGRPEAVRPGN